MKISYIILALTEILRTEGDLDAKGFPVHSDGHLDDISEVEKCIDEKTQRKIVAILAN